MGKDLYQEHMDKHYGDIRGAFEELIESFQKEEMFVEALTERLAEHTKAKNSKEKQLQEFFDRSGETKIETHIGTIKYNIGHPLELDKKQVTEDYKEIKEVTSIDKNKIRADLKAGMVLPRAKIGDSKTFSVK